MRIARFHGGMRMVMYHMKLIEVTQSTKLRTLSRNAYFDDLPETLLKNIASHTQLREYERGDILLWEGDSAGDLHIIKSGSVKLYRVSPQGRQYIVSVLTEGATCNEVPAFDGGVNPSMSRRSKHHKCGWWKLSFYVTWSNRTLNLP